MILSVWLNWLVSAGTILATYVLLPYNIHRLGDQAYGTWLLITSITGYLGLLTLGAPMATLRYVARYAAEGNEVELERALGTFAGMYLAMGGIALVIGGGLFIAFVSVYQVPASLVTQSQVAFLVVVFCVGVGFIQQLPYGILAAYQDFRARTLIQGIVLLVRVSLNLVLVWAWPGVVALALVNLGVTAGEMLLCWMVIRRRHPQLRIHPRRFDRAMLQSILSFSLFVMLLGMGAQLSFQTDSLVIGGFLDLAMIPHYAVANSLTQYLVEFVAAIALVVMPSSTSLHAQGDAEAMHRLILKWSKLALSLALLACGYLMVLGPRFLTWWLGPEFEGLSGQVLRILAFSFLFFIPARGVAQPILMGIGRPGPPSIAFAAAGVLNFGLSLLWVRPFGLIGVAWGTAIPNIILAVAMIWMACTAVGLPIRTYLGHVVPRPLVGAVAPVLLLVALDRAFNMRTLTALAAAGVGAAIIYGVACLFFVYRADPDVDPRAVVRAVVDRLRGRPAAEPRVG